MIIITDNFHLLLNNFDVFTIILHILSMYKHITFVYFLYSFFKKEMDPTEHSMFVNIKFSILLYVYDRPTIASII